eukprot:12884341-Prorocentrum_lima.AAC.1
MVYKEHIEMAREEYEPTCEEYLDRLVWAVVASRNRYSDRSGFSALQRVFGVQQRLPRSLTSDDMLDPMDLAMTDK